MNRSYYISLFAIIYVFATELLIFFSYYPIKSLHIVSNQKYILKHIE